MNFYNLHPNYQQENPQQVIQEILRNILVRTNLVPRTRHIIGWRGIKDSSSETEGWTAKIEGKKGVYGIWFKQLNLSGDWIEGQFKLNYFPDPDEELVDNFSLQAGILTQHQEYQENIRNFLEIPELRQVFAIGTITLFVNQSRESILLKLDSDTHKRIIAKDGVYITGDNQPVELIKPGGYDQDIPAFEIANSFFRVLAASLSFNLESPPVYLLKYDSHPGTEIVYRFSGESETCYNDNIKKNTLCLGYGVEPIVFKISSIPKTLFTNSNSVVWTQGNPIPDEFSEEPWWSGPTLIPSYTSKTTVQACDTRPRLIVLTGFLGSGKTSFLQNFIEYQASKNRFVAVIQNEIGEIGIDGKLLEQEYAVTEMDEGCVCCTLIGNLKNAVTNLLSEFNPDFIVLETTGLANPYNLIEELPELSDKINFDSVTTLVDGLNIETALKEFEIAKDQVKAADIILLNKKDLLTHVELDQLHQKLRKLNPSAPILPTQNGDINPRLIYDCDSEFSELTDSNQRHRNNKNKIIKKHHHTTHVSESFTSQMVEFKRPVNKKRFLQTLDQIPKSIFRIKGVIEFEDSKTPILVQFVAGRYELSEFNQNEGISGFLIVIGQNLPSDYSVKSFSMESLTS